MSSFRRAEVTHVKCKGSTVAHVLVKRQTLQEIFRCDLKIEVPPDGLLFVIYDSL